MMYVDGYNFYYAIKRNAASTPIHLGWCDFSALARQFMLPQGAVLLGIKYFTAPVGRFGADGGPLGGEAARQQVWLDAVSSIEDLEIVEGYHTGDVTNPRGRKEKETDVNIAISVVIDAVRDRYDRAILLTGDRDQRPTVRAISTEFGKRADVWVSPNQEVGFWKAAEGYSGVRVRTVTPTMLRKSRLPETITLNNRVIEAPRAWRANGR
jgi:hypothetical protein